jgi:hypothetical protein
MSRSKSRHERQLACKNKTNTITINNYKTQLLSLHTCENGGCDTGGKTARVGAGQLVGIALNREKQTVKMRNNINITS